jgi:hypothetical protein
MATSVTLGGTVNASGGSTVTRRGVIYGTVSGLSLTRGTAVDVGSGTGAFTTSVSVAAVTTYYYRAFATNSGGTSYGTEESFTTPAAPVSSLQIVNTSTRVQVGTGSNVLITGLVLKGEGQKSYLVRGVGPTLASFGVSGALADPTLSVFNGQGVVVASNDDWNSSLATIFASAGAFALPSGSHDAALVITLSAGSYTFQISGVGGTSGVALVEVYELP